MRRTVTIILMAALAAVAAGCGTTATKSPEQTQSPGTATSSPSPPSSQSQGQVGDKFTVTSGDAKYDVTLLSVDQQARPESEYGSAKAGHHLAATQLRVTAITSTDENSTNSVTVTGTNEQAYGASLTAVAAGTNFASGRILLQPGSSLVGWVPFELPDGVRIARVQWTPAAGFGSHSAEWRVNSSATSSPGATSPGQATNPADVVKAYFDAINLRDYQKAWNLGGKNTTSSYSSFVSGFKNTVMVSVQILDFSGDIGTGVVTARITSLEADGSTKVFQGTYTVKNGVIAEFNVRQVS